MPVREGEAGIRARRARPRARQTPKLALADVRVVEQDDPSLAELRQPRLEVVGDGVVRVAAVDVEQVDRAVGEVRRRLVEGLREQARERAAV